MEDNTFILNSYINSLKLDLDCNNIEKMQLLMYLIYLNSTVLHGENLEINNSINELINICGELLSGKTFETNCFKKDNIPPMTQRDCGPPPHMREPEMHSILCEGADNFISNKLLRQYMY